MKRLTDPHSRRRRGLSPFRRRNPGDQLDRRQHVGSIPAWAGEPLPVCPVWASQEVYPRVGGGTMAIFESIPHSQGLSPRGRGNLLQNTPAHIRFRSIPAWAGEPRAFKRPLLARAVYPRVGGEPSQPCQPPSVSWVYPRVGGGTPDSPSMTGPRLGLSPRGRGNRVTPPPTVVGTGSIPAWAGEP